MANPAISAALTSNIWTKVVTNKTDFSISTLTGNYSDYEWTYRVTGDPAPDPVTNLNEAVSFTDVTESFSFSAAVDLYLMPRGFAGLVRVDA